MTWTVAFALPGALIFSMLVAPVVASLLFRDTTREWDNPVLTFVREWYRRAVRRAIDHH
jgi:cobalt-zinc-cadmium resistance protein CzcA